MSLSAAEVLAELTRLGHNTNIEKQAYRSRIHGQTAVLYDPNGSSDEGPFSTVEVRASEVDYYVGKGFLVDKPVAAAPAAGKGK